MFSFSYLFYRPSIPHHPPLAAPSTGHLHALWAGSAVARGDCILEVWVVWQQRTVAVSHGWILKLCVRLRMKCTRGRGGGGGKQKRWNGTKTNGTKGGGLDSKYQNRPFALWRHPSSHPCINPNVRLKPRWKIIKHKNKSQNYKLKRFHVFKDVDLTWHVSVVLFTHRDLICPCGSQLDLRLFAYFADVQCFCSTASSSGS